MINIPNKLILTLKSQNLKYFINRIISNRSTSNHINNITFQYTKTTKDTLFPSIKSIYTSIHSGITIINNPKCHYSTTTTTTKSKSPLTLNKNSITSEEINGTINYLYSLEPTQKNFEEKKQLLNQIYEHLENNTVVDVQNNKLLKSSTTLINLFIEVDDIDKAISIFTKYVPDSTSIESYYIFHSILISLLKFKGIEESIEFFSKWLSTFTEYPQNRQFLEYLKSLHTTQLHIQQGTENSDNNTTKVDVYKRIYKILQDRGLGNGNVHIGFVIFNLWNGNFNEAMSIYKHYIKEGGKPSLYIYAKFIQSLIPTGKIKRCITILDWMLQDNIDVNFAIYQNLFQMCAKMHEGEFLRKMVEVMFLNTKDPKEIAYLIFYNSVQRQQSSTPKEHGNIYKELEKQLYGQSKRVQQEIIDTAIRCFLIYNHYEKALEWHCKRTVHYGLPPSRDAVTFFMQYHINRLDSDPKVFDNAGCKTIWTTKYYDTIVEVEERMKTYIDHPIDIGQIFSQIENFLTEFTFNPISIVLPKDSESEVDQANKLSLETEPHQNILHDITKTQNLLIHGKLMNWLKSNYFQSGNIPPGIQLIRLMCDIGEDVELYKKFIKIVPDLYKPVTFNSNVYTRMSSSHEMIEYLMLEDRDTILRSKSIWNTLLYKLASESHTEYAIKIALEMMDKDLPIQCYNTIANRVFNNHEMTEDVMNLVNYIINHLFEEKRKNGPTHKHSMKPIAFAPIMNVVLQWKLNNQPPEEAYNYFRTMEQKDQFSFDLAVKALELMYPAITNVDTFHEITKEFYKLDKMMNYSPIELKRTKLIQALFTLWEPLKSDNGNNEHIVSYTLKNLIKVTNNLSPESMSMIMRATRDTQFHVLVGKRLHVYTNIPNSVIDQLRISNSIEQDKDLEKMINSYKPFIQIYEDNSTPLSNAATEFLDKTFLSKREPTQMK
ncbi:hypothetical protein DLAC_07651 [Tieghemostelium lacteum]|uniref:Pentatricopeptide repeat-containing protein n=1 Tax=Tieghemostelium lacteum TaxID=361077 RepID=A0A151ZD23_TIELA|nr:hypothetical protein DLAC_07651 [Tieghemostelium lacteum]|eukprot:KYQ91847.1 hypothetical protein DLAC_07651 [Tieghemostelium lacteum]